jgi:hypothetical protein
MEVSSVSIVICSHCLHEENSEMFSALLYLVQVTSWAVENFCLRTPYARFLATRTLIYIHISLSLSLSLYIYIYIYIYCVCVCLCVCVCVCVCVCLYATHLLTLHTLITLLTLLTLLTRRPLGL